MEKSSPPPPVGQVIQVKPLVLKMTIGRTRWINHTTPARVKAIAGNPNKLRAFRDAKTDISQFARIADVDGQRGSFPPDRFAIDDVRDAMKAGDVELFFSFVTLSVPSALRHCLNDPTIFGIIQGWGEAANSGNQDARALLTGIGTALGRAAYRRPPLPATEQPLSKRDAVSVSAAVSLRLRRYTAFRETKSPAGAHYLIEEELNKNRRISPKRKPAILSSFRGKARKLEETRSGHKA